MSFARFQKIGAHKPLRRQLFLIDKEVKEFRVAMQEKSAVCIGIFQLFRKTMDDDRLLPVVLSYACTWFRSGTPCSLRPPDLSAKRSELSMITRLTLPLISTCTEGIARKSNVRLDRELEHFPDFFLDGGVGCNSLLLAHLTRGNGRILPHGINDYPRYCRASGVMWVARRTP